MRVYKRAVFFCMAVLSEMLCSCGKRGTAVVLSGHRQESVQSPFWHFEPDKSMHVCVSIISVYAKGCSARHDKGKTFLSMERAMLQD